MYFTQKRIFAGNVWSVGNSSCTNKCMHAHISSTRNRQLCQVIAVLEDSYKSQILNFRAPTPTCLHQLRKFRTQYNTYTYRMFFPAYFTLIGALCCSCSARKCKFTKFENLGGSHMNLPHPLHRSAANLACDSKATVRSSVQSFTFTGAFCCHCWARNSKLDEFGIFEAGSNTCPFTHPAEIWHGRVNLWHALPHKISTGSVLYHVTSAWLYTSNLTNFGIFGALLPTPFTIQGKCGIQE